MARRTGRFAAGFGLATLVLALAALPAGAAGAAGADAGAVTRINGVMYLGDLPTVVADKRGFFGRQHVNADVSYRFSGKRNLELLRSGRVDFALMSLTPLVMDILADPDPGQPDDPVILASVVHSTRLNQVVALADAGFGQPAELAGQRIGLMKGTNAEFVWWLFAAYNGFDPGSATLVDRSIEAIPDALINGEVDAAVIWEPWTSRLQHRLADRLVSFTGSNVYTAKWVLVAPRRIVEQQPELSRAVLTAYRDAIGYIDRQAEAAIRLYAAHAGVDTAMLHDNWDALVYELSLDWSLLATFQQQLDWGRRAGYQLVSGEPAVLAMIHPGPLRVVEPGAVSIPAAPEREERPLR